MFSRRELQYQSVPQGDSHSVSTGPGLFVSHNKGYGGYMQNQFQHKGLSFDYIPNISDNDFTDQTQGCLSRFGNLVVIFLVYLLTFLTFPISGWFVLKTVPNYQRVVVFRLGRVRPPKGPGVVLMLPLIDQWQKVDLRTRAFNIPPCCVTTSDGGLVSVGADIQFRIWSPVMSVVAVQDLNASTRLTAQKAMTHLLGKKTVREIQSDRLKLGEYLQVDINELTRPWGLEVDRVELTVGAVLKGPENGISEPAIKPPAGAPSGAGLEGLAGTIQQLAVHFLGDGGTGQPRKGDSVSFTDELRMAPQSLAVPSSRAPQLAAVPSSVASQSVARPSSRAPRLAAVPSSVEELLGAVKLLLSESLVSQVGACFQFQISTSGGQLISYYVDLSQGSGSAGSGSPLDEPDVILSMSDADLLAMFEGRLRPYAAYSTGRLRVQGELKTAMKLEELIKLLRH